MPEQSVSESEETSSPEPIPGSAPSPWINNRFEKIVDPEANKPHNRMNDGKIDRRGQRPLATVTTRKKLVAAAEDQFHNEMRESQFYPASAAATGPPQSWQGSMRKGLR
jgi:hypothetical protein